MWSQSRLPSLRVLVVDDDERARSVLTALVRTFGVEVIPAEDGALAYELVLDRRPDLILCDARMRMRDGFGLVRRLRRDPRFRRILTIAVSGWWRPAAIVRARDAGFDGYAAKPVRADVLARLLDRALDLQETQEQEQGA